MFVAQPSLWISYFTLNLDKVLLHSPFVGPELYMIPKLTEKIKWNKKELINIISNFEEGCFGHNCEFLFGITAASDLGRLTSSALKGVVWSTLPCFSFLFFYLCFLCVCVFFLFFLLGRFLMICSCYKLQGPSYRIKTCINSIIWSQVLICLKELEKIAPKLWLFLCLYAKKKSLV